MNILCAFAFNYEGLDVESCKWRWFLYSSLVLFVFVHIFIILCLCVLFCLILTILHFHAWTPLKSSTHELESLTGSAEHSLSCTVLYFNPCRHLILTFWIQLRITITSLRSSFMIYRILLWAMGFIGDVMLNLHGWINSHSLWLVIFQDASRTFHHRDTTARVFQSVLSLNWKRRSMWHEHTPKKKKIFIFPSTSLK